MRLHIFLDDDVVEELDRRAGSRRRSAFITAAVQRALDDARRWEEIESALDSIRPSGHAWDEDPAGWVRGQRRGDPRRVG